MACRPQSSITAQEEVKRLIVSIHAKLGDRESAGAGIIFAADKDQLYVMTANHVVRDGSKDGESLWIELADLSGKQLPAKLLSHFDLNNDLAVLSVSTIKLQGIDLTRLSFDRLGDPNALTRGDPVFLLGHPNGVRWSLSVTPDGFAGADGAWLKFESRSLFPGHSGGALLNFRMEIVGMLRSDAQPNGEALSMNTALTQLRSWQYPVQLRRRFQVGNLQTLSAGAGYTCSIGSQDQVYCWGANSHGELGNGSKADSAVPARVVGGVALVSVSSGYWHTCGVAADGSAFCWGDNVDGELGNNSDQTSVSPSQVASELRFAQVSAGFSHTCGLTTGGLAYCWGDNENGQLGNGARNSADTPVPVSGGMKFRSVHAGTLFTCGISTDDAVYCWGSNAQGRLGNGSKQDDSRTPVRVSGPGFLSISIGGGGHVCGIGVDGKAYCWGRNEDGELGNGSHLSSPVPVPVSGGLTFQSISAGKTFSCGISNEGVPLCWGWGNGTVVISEEDRPDDVPAVVAGSHGKVFKSVTTGQTHACARTVAGQVYCWGGNNYGQLGNGGKEASVRPVLAPVP